MKTLKQFLEGKEISKEKFESMSAEEKAKLFNEMNAENVKAFTELEKSSVSKDDVQTMLDAINKERAEQVSTIYEAMKEIAVSARNSNNAQGEVKTTLAKEILENKSVLKSLTKGSTESVELKALTNRAAITNNEQALDLADIGQLATGRMRAIDLFPKITISGSNDNGTVRYYDWDQATTVRAAAMIAEGGTFPESTAKWEKFTVDLKKIGDSLPVTEEFFEDEAMFAAELQMFLLLNVDLEANDQVINGDGTGNNLTGLVTSSPAFVPVASGISDASIYDLIVKVKEDVETDQDAKYQANFALMNIADVNLMKLKKDANENYILPPFVDRSGNVVDGITIVVDNKVVANTMIMGDSRYGRVYEKNGVTISRGVVNAQFVEDTTTLKVRKRMLLLVRNVDQTGFRKVTSISAALTTLAL